MTNINLSFKKVASLPSAGSLVQGSVYFVDGTNCIYIATDASNAVCYAGVRSVAYNDSTNVLSFVDQTGTPVSIDFSEVITEDKFAALLSALGMTKSGNTYKFEANGDGISGTNYLVNSSANTVKGALTVLDSKIHDVETAAGVTSVGGQTGDITLKGDGTNNGDVNLTMSGKQMQASIVGLKSAAYTESSAYDASGAAAGVLGSSADASTVKTVYGVDKKVDAINSTLRTDLAVTLESADGTGSILKTYTVKQGGTSIGTIDIPKDFLVKSGQVKTVETAGQPYSGAVVGDKYLDFVVNAKDSSVAESHIYIPVKDLTDVYTGGATSTVTVTVDSSNLITANVNTGSITTSLLDSSVQTALNKANSAVQSVTGETAVADSSYVAVSVEAATSNNAVTLTSHANVTTKNVSTATNSSDGLATAYDVQQYIAAQLCWAEFAE
jgi:hypothetical protein